MSYILVLLIVSAVNIYYCQCFRREWGENVYIAISKDRRECSFVCMAFWTFAIFAMKFTDDYYGGLGWPIYFLSMFAVYWFGQALCLIDFEHNVKVDTAKMEVQAGRFHQESPQRTKPQPQGPEASQNKKPDDPAFNFDPARFGK